ncbi:MAG: biopolymer transporter ExbD [Proteobacteria bacterium]|nr:biopolymer transporter ExbD [Pseudomonadota bacterium]
MPRLSAARREAGIEITPLIDVVFLLLIFFMVSANFVQQQGIEVTLPESASAVAGPVETFDIAISEAGEYWVAGVSVGSDAGRLRSAVEGYANTIDAKQLAEHPVEVRADAGALHQWVVYVLDACAMAGFVRISLATTKPLPQRDSGANQ